MGRAGRGGRGKRVGEWEEVGGVYGGYPVMCRCIGLDGWFDLSTVRFQNLMVLDRWALASDLVMAYLIHR